LANISWIVILRWSPAPHYRPLRPGDRLVEGGVDLVRLVYRPPADPGHRLAEGLEIVGPGLFDESIAIGQEEDPLLCAGLPEAPRDVEQLCGAERLLQPGADRVRLVLGLDDGEGKVMLVVGGDNARLRGRLPPTAQRSAPNPISAQFSRLGRANQPMTSWPADRCAVGGDDTAPK
jgi:hypothetical protein